MTLRAGIIPSDFLCVYGADRVDLLQRLSTGDLRPLLEEGRVVSTVFTDDRGKTIDWVWLVSCADHLKLRTSQGRAEKLAAWIDRYTIVEDVRSEIAEGPAAWTALAIFGDDELAVAPGQARFVDGNALLGGIAQVDTEGGVEMWLPSAQAAQMLETLQNKGAWGIDAEGFEGWRLRMGIPSPTTEFREPVNPLELRLNRSVGWNKGCYIGQEVISRLDSYDKVARLLTGFDITAAAADSKFTLPEDLTGVKLRSNGKTIGRVTSLLAASKDNAAAKGLAVVERAALQAAAEIGPIAATEATASGVEMVWTDGSIGVTLMHRPFAKASQEQNP